MTKNKKTLTERVETLETSIVELKENIRRRQVLYKRFKKDISDLFLKSIVGLIYLVLAIYFGGVVQVIFGVIAAILLGLAMAKMLFMARKIAHEK